MAKDRRGACVGTRMNTTRRITAAVLALGALVASAAPAAAVASPVEPVDQVVCWVKTGDEIKCFHWGP